jgi:hypothetical protein
MAMSDNDAFERQLAALLKTTFTKNASEADIRLRISLVLAALAGQAYQGVHGGGPPHFPADLLEAVNKLK